MPTRTLSLRTRMWVLLLLAIASEVFATLALRAAVDVALWNVAAVVGYIVAFTMLGMVLRLGMSVGATYAIWGALGVAATTVLGTILFNETLSVFNWLGIAAIVIGVVLVEGKSSSEPATTEVAAT